MIGIGNDLRQDDGVGLEVARRLKPYSNECVDILEHGGEATSLLDTWADIPRVVLVDAVRSGAAAGAILRVDVHGGGFRQEHAWYSSHSLGLADAVALGRRLNRLPPSLVIFGIEGRRFGFGPELSAETTDAALLLVDRLVRELGLRDGCDCWRRR